MHDFSCFEELVREYTECLEVFQLQSDWENEEVLYMFSEALRIMDQNTVMYMIEEQQKEIEEEKKKNAERQNEIEKQQREIEYLQKLLKEAGVQ